MLDSRRHRSRHDGGHTYESTLRKTCSTSGGTATFAARSPDSTSSRSTGRTSASCGRGAAPVATVLPPRTRSSGNSGAEHVEPPRTRSGTCRSRPDVPPAVSSASKSRVHVCIGAK
eukprot:6113254-Prymnesium_polylepis.1